MSVDSQSDGDNYLPTPFPCFVSYRYEHLGFHILEMKHLGFESHKFKDQKSKYVLKMLRT